MHARKRLVPRRVFTMWKVWRSTTPAAAATNPWNQATPSAENSAALCVSGPASSGTATPPPSTPHAAATNSFSAAKSAACAAAPCAPVRHELSSLPSSKAWMASHLRQHHVSTTSAPRQHHSQHHASTVAELKGMDGVPPPQSAERPRDPGGVAAFMSAHSKTPHVTPGMEFSSGGGLVRGRRVEQQAFV